jgi:SAM-dependent methyltransferase
VTSRSRRLKYTLVADALDLVVRHTPFLAGDAPPRAINIAGGGDFRSMGRGLVRSLEERAALTAGDTVLDIGCGIGRTAVALAERHPRLDYDGFDVVPFAISWIRRRLRDHPTFRFRHVDLYNDLYNPRGSLAADAFAFPYPDAAFDLIFATSVFTHLPYADLAHYLHESARCLRPGGRIYLTCFLLDDASRAAIADGRTAFGFGHPTPDGATESDVEPDLAVAFDALRFDAAVAGAGLTVAERWTGHWRGGAETELQDACLLRKG